MAEPNIYRGGNIPLARNLRKNMTKQERHLWFDFLRSCPVRIQRQKAFGSYIVDFYCSSAKLVIELDGGQHFETDGLERDRVRDAYLSGIGLRVLHVSNLDVDTQFAAVCEQIAQAIGCI